MPTNPVPAAQPNWLKNDNLPNPLQISELAPPPSLANPQLPVYNPAVQTIPSVSYVQPATVIAPAPVPAPAAQISYQPPPTIVYPNPVLDQTISLHHDLMKQMSDFERQQQEQFQRDLEEQRRILEAKQREYKVS